MYINALFETLTEVLPSPSYFKTNIDTRMGFLLGKLLNKCFK